MSLWTIFLANDHRYTVKWRHYFPFYERYLEKFVDTPVKMLELGVFKGGSLQMWKRYFGPLASITGIDFDPECVFEEEQIIIRTGYQQDLNFLAAVNEELGPFDVILDDCGHQPSEVIASFEFLYPKMSANGVYIIEDTDSFYDNPLFAGMLAQKYQELNCWPKTKVPTEFTKTTISVHQHEFMIIFERGQHDEPIIVEGGSQ